MVVGGTAVGKPFVGVTTSSDDRLLPTGIEVGVGGAETAVSVPILPRFVTTVSTDISFALARWHPDRRRANTRLTPKNKTRGLPRKNFLSLRDTIAGENMTSFYVGWDEIVIGSLRKNKHAI